MTSPVQEWFQKNQKSPCDWPCSMCQYGFYLVTENDKDFKVEKCFKCKGNGFS